MPSGQDRAQVRALLPVKRFALGVVTGLVLAVSLLAACGADSTEWDTLTVNQHLYLKDPAGTTFKIGIGKDASGKDLVTATRVGD
ncbi:hypothetical protein [Mycobacterium deserti]|uniref:Uncharacterized protein n=1 Tax=Mycobacterium deserti TaxID=2978347 RepID=A0ABT2MCM8_9MYCO|nr:hypothetical protein [Mycobacterium deserti]MCT7658875.1 hypothetical protein [Mycobacterium deserti]